MICPRCRRQVPRAAPVCSACGTVTGRGAATALELVAPDGRRAPLTGVVTVGRDPASTLPLTDRSVSRHHARVLAAGGPPLLEDAGSSYGTSVDGRPVTVAVPLRDGSVVRVGETDLRVERVDGRDEAGDTVVVRAPAWADAFAEPAHATQVGFRPRVRPGWALKRLAASEGAHRVVLRDLRSGALVRMDDADARLFELIDGERSLPELMGEAEATLGPEGIPRLARLLAELSKRGFLAGSAVGDDDAQPGLLQRAIRPRRLVWGGAGDVFEWTYRHGGWVLFTTPALCLLALVAALGAAAFVALVLGRYGTPFVVADRVGLGGAVFLLGRFLGVALHEFAHGMTVASFGRRVSAAGMKFMMLIPYAYVDTSEGWFEPRRRRLAISGAGPASDAVVGGGAALGSFALPAGSARDVLFQVALGAYMAAFFNLNPFMDRDGYHMAVDWLGIPGLRAKARAHVQHRIAGRPVPAGSRALAVYGALSVVWMLLAILFAVVLTHRYLDPLAQVLHARWIVWTIFVALYTLLAIPVVVTLGRPLMQRRRAGTREEGDAFP